MWATIKQTLHDLWVESFTKIWGEMKLIGGLCLAVAAYLGNIYNDPNVHSALDRLNIPVEVGLVFAVLGAVTLIMRSHDG